MRIAVAAILLGLMALPAQAQMGGGGGRRGGGGEKAAEPAKSKIDEKAYKAALERIPEPKEKYDPWGVTRPSTPAKTETVKKPK